MATDQKIHPVDVGQTLPAVDDSTTLERSDPIHPFPSNRHLSGDHQRVHPVHADASSSSTSAPVEPEGPPIEQTVPSDSEAGQSHPLHRRRWFRCICWTSLVLLILIILFGFIVLILYLVYKPKIPRYSLDNVQIYDFGMYSNGTIHASFNVSIKAINRNKRIGIYYDGGHMNVFYTNYSLCSGPVPFFYQRPKNTTMFVAVLTGSTEYGGTILMAELEDLEKLGWVPLDLRTHVPVRVKLGAIKIRVKFRVYCVLVVKALTPQQVASIRASNCTFHWKL